uniref:Uncharacterized protein n=1 Tax=Glossina brevipalpis TaxID=37001 RepID=A0A1A9WZ76_9MUSC
MSCAAFLCSVGNRSAGSRIDWWVLRLPPPIISMSSAILFPSSANASIIVATSCTPGSDGGDVLVLCCTGVSVRSSGERAMRLLRLEASSSAVCTSFTSFLVGGVPLPVIFDEPAGDLVTLLLGLNGFSSLIFMSILLHNDVWVLMLILVMLCKRVNLQNSGFQSTQQNLYKITQIDQDYD